MLLRLIPLSIAILINLVGCATDKGKSLRLEISQGVGGYTGAVRPIESPVEIKIGPVRSWKAEVKIYSKSVDGSKSFKLYSLSGNIDEDDKKFFHVRHFNKMGIDGRSFEYDKPIVTMEYWLKKNGQLIGDPGFKYPAYSEAYVRNNRKELSQFQKNAINNLKITPNFKNYSQEEQIISSDLLLKAMQTAIPDLTFNRNDLYFRAIGITRLFGRPALVGRLSGSANVAKAGRELSISMQGHWIYDIGTGLQLSAMVRMTLTGNVDGKPFDGESLMSWKTSSADFPDPPRSAAVQPYSPTKKPVTSDNKQRTKSQSASAVASAESRPIAIRWEGVSDLYWGSLTSTPRHAHRSRLVRRPILRDTAFGGPQDEVGALGQDRRPHPEGKRSECLEGWARVKFNDRWY